MKTIGVLAKCALVCALVLGTAGTLAAQQTPLPPGTSSPDQQQPATPSDPLPGIESLIEAKQYVRATNQLSAYLSAHPSDARALFDRGYIADAQGQTDAAESWYRKAVAADPKQFEARSALGLLLASKNDPAAVEQLQAASQLDPNPPNPAAKAQVDRVLARLEKKSNPTGARDALVDALRLTPETEDDTLLAAEIAANAGDAAIAEQEYRKVLAEDPASADATAGLAHLLIAENKDADAQPLVEAALKQHPGDPGLNAQLATILNAEGKPDQALAVLNKLHTLEPASQPVTAMLADAEFQAGKLDEADVLYQELLQVSPNDPGFLDAHGQILIRQQHYAQALAVFQRAVAAKPDDVDGWSGVAFADSKLARYQDELAALSMRSKYAEDNPGTLFLRATAYDNLHQTKAAADYYHRFLAAAQGNYPDQEWQAKHRLVALEK